MEDAPAGAGASDTPVPAEQLCTRGFWVCSAIYLTTVIATSGHMTKHVEQPVQRCGSVRVAG